MRQVTHALLTRPPLSHQKDQSEEISFRCFVRLACVKHTASVHPEPGSNSHVHIPTEWQLAVIFPFFTVFGWVFRLVRFEILFEFSGLFYCSIINVLCVAFLMSCNFLSLSHRLLFVNTFLNVFSTFNGEGGIWTLAPLLTTYSLSRGAPSAAWVLLQIAEKISSMWFWHTRNHHRWSLV